MCVAAREAIREHQHSGRALSFLTLGWCVRLGRKFVVAMVKTILTQTCHATLLRISGFKFDDAIPVLRVVTIAFRAILYPIVAGANPEIFAGLRIVIILFVEPL